VELLAEIPLAVHVRGGNSGGLSIQAGSSKKEYFNLKIISLFLSKHKRKPLFVDGNFLGVYNRKNQARERGGAMKTLVIEREAVKNNIGVIKERAGEAVIYAVLTGDGQGAGLVELARGLRAGGRGPLAGLLGEGGIGRFAVSEPAEAAALRRAGFVEEEILMLRPTVDRAELEQLIDLNVVCTVGSADTGMALNGAAEARSTVVEAHIQIDTGMGFGGFLADEPEKILSVYRNLPNVAVSGICTQLHARKKGGEDLAARLGQFHRVVEAIRAAGFETGVVHAAGSYALLHCADARLDGVRAGSPLLGRRRR